MTRKDCAFTLEFLGHNSWFVAGEQSFLIDPLLLPDFGNSALRPFKLHPHPAIIESRHLEVSDVIVTHEHSDHIDPRSLSLLKAGTKIHVGPVFPNYLAEAIVDKGLIIVRHSYRERFNLGGIPICMYPCDPATAFWEQRVSQLLIGIDDQFSVSVFMAVDALISLEYLSEVESGRIHAAQGLLLSNNSYIMPPGGFGPLDSIFGESDTLGITGLNILSEMTDVPECLQAAKIIIAGGGIRRYDEFLHRPFCDQQEMARLCQKIAPNLEYHAPSQGDRIVINYSGITFETQKKSYHSTTNFNDAVPPPFEAVIIGGEQLHMAPIDLELQILAKVLSMSPIAEHWWSSNDSGPYIAIFLLLGKNINDIVRAVAIEGNSAQVIDLEICNINEGIKFAPFGIACFATDFSAIISGDVEIWDVAGKAIKSWHPPDHTLINMTSFLYSYFGEQVRPELARCCLDSE